MIEAPSLSKWLSGKSLLWQMNFSVMMKFSPILIFMWGMPLCKMMGYSQEMSLVIPGMAGCATFVLFLYWDFGNRNASTATLPLNMTVTWNASKTDDIYTNIIEYVPLNEDPQKGLLSYGVKFDTPQHDEKNEPFQHVIFLTRYPLDKAFRRIPGQIVAYGGSVFEGMAARIVATYANEYLDIKGYSRDEQRMEQFKILHVKWCLEDSKTDQMSIGLYQENPLTKEIIGSAAQLEIDRKATRLGMQNRELEGQIRSYGEAFLDSETRGKKNLNRLIDIQDRIKKERSLVTRLLRDKWVRVILMVIAVGVLAYAARYYKWV